LLLGSLHINPALLRAATGPSATKHTIRLHDVRHSHATLMLAGGVPVEVISKRLGHSRISTTMDLYVHPSDEQQRSAADVFGRLVAGSEG